MAVKVLVPEQIALTSQDSLSEGFEDDTKQKESAKKAHVQFVDPKEPPETSSPFSEQAAAAPSLMVAVKPIKLRIYTMDRERMCELSFASGRYTKASEVVESVMKKLDIPAEMKDVFSLWMKSRNLQLQLKSYHVPVKLCKKWCDLLTQYTTASYDCCRSEEPILVLRRNAFLSLKEEKRLIAKKNSKVALDLLYHEAVRNVVEGVYPLEKDDLLELGGLQLAAENGQFDDAEHTLAKIKSIMGSYLPAYIVAPPPKVKSVLRSSNKTPGVEHELQKSYQEVWQKAMQGSQSRKHKEVDVERSAVAASLGKDEEDKLWSDMRLQLKLLYLQRCWFQQYYGSVMFQGQIERKSSFKQLLLYSDRTVTLAVNPHCVHLFSNDQPKQIILYLTYDQLSWDFQPATEEGENFFSSLWLEYDSFVEGKPVSKRFQIFSRQAPMMDAMISRCVDELNKTDEELKRVRIKQGGKEVLEPATITTNRTLTPLKNFQEDKLRCEVYDQEGGQISTGFFSLTRAFKKGRKRSDSFEGSPVNSPFQHQSSVEESSHL